MSQLSDNGSKPGLRPVPMNVYPTLNSLREVSDLAESKLPITDKNELHSLLMTHHNTLLSVLTRTIQK